MIPTTPLSLLNPAQQEAALIEIARQIKDAFPNEAAVVTPIQPPSVSYSTRHQEHSRLVGGSACRRCNSRRRRHWVYRWSFVMSSKAVIRVQ